MLDRTNPQNLARKAVLYRMVMPGHTCPYGLKAKDLLQRSGYEVDDHHLTTREETDAFKAQHGVPTTPQVFVDGKRVGGYDDLRRFLGKPVADPKATSYRPVMVLFTLTALTAMAASYAVNGTPFTLRAAASRAVASVPKARRPRITPNSGTNSELSSSRNGSRLCMGSTSASPVHSAATSRPHARTPKRGSRLWADTAPETRADILIKAADILASRADSVA